VTSPTRFVDYLRLTRAYPRNNNGDPKVPVSGIAGAVSKPVPATDGGPAGTEFSMSSALAYRIEERWGLSNRRAV
jgi:hypothetical protein